MAMRTKYYIVRTQFLGLKANRNNLSTDSIDCVIFLPSPQSGYNIYNISRINILVRIKAWLDLYFIQVISDLASIRVFMGSN